jgi:hypothetical protein
MDSRHMKGNKIINPLINRIIYFFNTERNKKSNQIIIYSNLL